MRWEKSNNISGRSVSSFILVEKHLSIIALVKRYQTKLQRHSTLHSFFQFGRRRKPTASLMVAFDHQDKPQA